MAAMESVYMFVLLITLASYTDSRDATESNKRSDDGSILTMEIQVQKQASLLNTLQNTLAAMQNRLDNLEHRLPGTFRQVAFSVRFKAGEFHGIALTNRSILQFDDIVSNIGNCYNSNTGIFTAPVSGVYAFFLHQMSADNNTSVWLGIEKHGAGLVRLYTEGQEDSRDQGSSQVTTHLTAGEQVWVRQYSGDAVSGGYMTVFTGHLLTAD